MTSTNTWWEKSAELSPAAWGRAVTVESRNDQDTPTGHATGKSGAQSPIGRILEFFDSTTKLLVAIGGLIAASLALWALLASLVFSGPVHHGGNTAVTNGNKNSTITSGSGNSTVTNGNKNSTTTSGSGNSTVTNGNGNSTVIDGDGNTAVTG
jgi:Ca2+-binding RTX toxin-like protein